MSTSEHNQPTSSTESVSIITSEAPTDTHAIRTTEHRSSPLLQKEQRFVPNKVERAWILYQLCAHGAPATKGKTLESHCQRVATAAIQRNVSDAQIVCETSTCGVKWRREYMAGIKAVNVHYIATGALKQAKTLLVEDAVNEHGEEQQGECVVLVRDGGVEGDAQNILDKGLLEFKMEAGKRVTSSADSAAKTLTRRSGARREKIERLEKRKLDYEKVKKGKNDEKKQRTEERRASDRFHLKAQAMSANAASASVEIAAKQCEQFGAFLSLYAAKHCLTLPAPSLPMPVADLPAQLEMDPALLAPNGSPGEHMQQSVQDGDVRGHHGTEGTESEA